MNKLALISMAAAMIIGAAAGAVATTSAPAPDPSAEIMNPMIAGQAMLPTRDVVDNVAHSPEHTVFVRDLRETGIDGVLRQQGPFTVFAPTDDAFALAGAIGGKAALAKVLGYHIVRGRLDSKALLRLIEEGGGQARLTTVEGATLVATLNGPTNIVLIDGKGQVADIAIYDVYQSNGVLQVIDRVVRPG